MRATFLLELGGRLWSLVHTPTGRELLHVNPIFQPGNLGTDLREGEGSLADLWYAWQAQRIAAHEQVPVDEALHKRIRQEFPPPASLQY